MKKRSQVLTTIIAPMLLSGVALANPLATSAPLFIENTEFQGYIGMSGAFSETALLLKGNGNTLDLGEQDLSGLRLNAGLNIAGGLTVDGFFQHLQGDDEALSNDFGGVFTYKQQLANGFSAFVGAGYQWRKVEFEGIDGGTKDEFSFNNNAILANLGIEYQVQSFIARLSYTHGFTNSSDGSITETVNGVSNSVAGDLEKNDLGTVSISGTYLITPNTSFVASYSAELLEEATITDNSAYSLGVQYKF